MPLNHGNKPRAWEERLLVTPAQVKAVLKAASEPIPYRNVVFEKSVVPHVRPEFALAAAGMLTSLQEQPFHERVLKAATSARDAQKESLAKKITQPNQLSAAQSAAEESIEAIATALDPVKAVGDDEKGKVVLARLESTGSAIINEYHQPNNGNDGGAPATQQGAEGSDSPSAPAEDGAAQEPAQDENANPAEGDDASDEVQADGGVLRRTSRVSKPILKPTSDQEEKGSTQPKSSKAAQKIKGKGKRVVKAGAHIDLDSDPARGQKSKRGSRDDDTTLKQPIIKKLRPAMTPTAMGAASLSMTEGRSIAHPCATFASPAVLPAPSAAAVDAELMVQHQNEIKAKEEKIKAYEVDNATLKAQLEGAKDTIQRQEGELARMREDLKSKDQAMEAREKHIKAEHDSMIKNVKDMFAIAMQAAHPRAT
mmetsp:Transcript_17695/g.55226  ORF Transcript_17695/g.55226 Transcript_17695/m.55226 type:complete len:425 (+) Transcript_17695:367-1641(+)